MSSSRRDSNRIIIAVTGANAGLGLGYCHRILRQLSTAPTAPPPDALELPLEPGHSPRRLALKDASLSNFVNTQPPPTLTLILACRSRQRAEVAIKQLKKQHELGLIGRKMRGAEERKGWLEGLEIVFEELDVDRVGGQGGVLDFASRIRDNYPHLTTLVLNAGIGAFLGLDWAGAMRQLMVDPVGTVLEPQFILQEIGRKSGDGLRGGVWGVNVLSTYILAKELRSHMAKSPVNLPLSPRIIYVTSSQGKASFLPQPPSSDKQLIQLEESYGASKYMGSIVTSHLDAEFSQTEALPQVDQNSDEDVGERKVRVLRLDPGVVHTGMFAQWLPFFMEWLMVITLHFVSAPWDVLQKSIRS
ncbi:hypothetical protein HD553DRAFT_267755 [Filobasidium floriforme]|uniref:uncharacterized protein n=1 Tax=Filobasidium floriforme TaxID=5210 RepID=UPI001E8E9479|nr:uncharacterized protein HD553DRAFT_267755 [Filobasidium floriforme]KAH8089227.1 hypothetical protein HD553DRAFT_267755 [Filobasidium floriforme]